ncbi:MAG: hypothetical protein IPM99_07010 [Rubrivivax sp.]|nr:hypothetical protein [Rubrivivax sp.]
MIALHGLAGHAGGVVLERLGALIEWRRKVGEGSAAVLGGLLIGAATGLAVDLAAGGLTLGGGLIAGSVLGALGAAGGARAQFVRGLDRGWVGLTPAAMQQVLRAACCATWRWRDWRGRGEWRDGEAHRTGARRSTRARRRGHRAGRALAGALDRIRTMPARPRPWTPRLQALLARCTQRTLDLLYPGAWPAAPE